MRIKIFISSFILILLCYTFVRILPIYYTNVSNHFIYNTACIIQDYASVHNKMFFSQKYKNEVEQYMKNEIPISIKKLDEVFLDFKNYKSQIIQNKYTNLSKKECYDKLDDFEVELDTIDFYLYVKLLKITDKYLFIPIGNIPTDNSGPYDKILSYYFEKYKINDDELKTFNLHLIEQYKEINKFRNEIENLNY